VRADAGRRNAAQCDRLRVEPSRRGGPGTKAGVIGAGRAGVVADAGGVGGARDGTEAAPIPTSVHTSTALAAAAGFRVR